ncbi:hypothetical protein G6F31_017194 [Rhizopus arrhizus]|nr:hypothetical protein G6F31_017194 [Rhizopus arrhizus]
MLERDVQVRQDLAFRHQRDHFVHVRIRVHVVQARPDAHFGQGQTELGHTGLDRAAVPETAAEFHVHAVGTGVLRDHQHFLHAGLDQALGLAQHIAHRTADQVAAHRRDDAEAAAVIAAFGNLQVGVVARRELDALRRHQVQVGVVVLLGRGGVVHGAHHLFILLGTGHRQHAGVHLADRRFLTAHTAGDDDLAVLGQRFADGFQRFRLGAVDESTGVDDDDVRIVVFGRDFDSPATRSPHAARDPD